MVEKGVRAAGSLTRIPATEHRGLNRRSQPASKAAPASRGRSLARYRSPSTRSASRKRDTQL
jgi:hypothetical protein